MAARQASAVGSAGLFSGTVGSFNGQRQLTHPDYVLVGDDGSRRRGRAARGRRDAAEAFARELIPVYPATKGLTSWEIAKACGVVLDVLGDLPDPLPDDVRERHELVGLGEAFRLIHRPRDRRATMRRAGPGCAYEEAFVLQVELARRRAAARALPAIRACARPGGLLEAFDARLPFTLTAGQREVGATIAARPGPTTTRCTGCCRARSARGKTVVALRAMLAVVDAGGQAALLAPTEVLAAAAPPVDHARCSGPLGRARAARRRRRRARGSRCSPGRMGTAARRAGAARRGQRRGRASSSARTPCSRTRCSSTTSAWSSSTSSTASASSSATPCGPRASDAAAPAGHDRDADPAHRRHDRLRRPGRLDADRAARPVARRSRRTWCPPARSRTSSSGPGQRVREEVAAGPPGVRRVPADRRRTRTPSRVDSGDEPEDARRRRAGRPPLAVLDVAAPAAPTARWPACGSRCCTAGMAPDEKDDVMRRFAAGDIDVLVATTVIEVGVDVPNATVMVVMDADRFGVSQLHQLRGRIGRGSAPGLCLLVTDAEDGHARRASGSTRSRPTLDGFELSRIDLQSAARGRRARRRPVRAPLVSCGCSSVLDDEERRSRRRAARTPRDRGRRRPGPGSPAPGAARPRSCARLRRRRAGRLPRQGVSR